MEEEYTEEEYTESKQTVIPQAASMVAVKRLHNLANQLEDKLSVVLRPSQPQPEKNTTVESGSALIGELGYLHNHLKDIFERLHV